MFERILIVVAHPDDEILGCGGLIARKMEKSEFRIVFVAEGSSCRFKENQTEEIAEAILARTHNAIESLKLLGILDVHFTNLECGRLDQVPILEINRVIEKHIVEFQPDTLISHSSKDANSDHRCVAEATLMATRPGAINYVPNVFACEILSSSEWAFSEAFLPNYFIPLSKENLDLKISSLLVYESEVKPFPFPRSPRGLTTLAQYRGMQSAHEYAEAFQAIRLIEN